METLDAYNKEARERIRLATQQVPLAGVACDKCEAEMMYDNPTMTLSSIPPMKTVVCPRCGYTGYKVVG